MDFLHCIDLLCTYRTKPTVQYMQLLIEYLIENFTCLFVTAFYGDLIEHYIEYGLYQRNFLDKYV
jgi:hypothetical protein